MGDLEVPNWLKELPSAPEFRPTDTEFADPIAYISKIEKEASAFGICKVIPPLPKPSKKFVFANLNKSLAKAPELVSDVNSKAVNLNAETDSGNRRNDGEFRAVFTTRHQELGHSLKRTKGLGPVSKQLAVHKQVWQSGEEYTLDQFESKAKAFARSQLALVKDVSPLVIESLFWKAASEKPIYVEYANDVPGSGFGEPEEPFQYSHKRRRKRKFYKKCQSSTNCENNKLDTTSNLPTEEVFVKNDSELSLESCKQSSSSSNAGSNMEGTAGWKLSNSPWNLQVISRSPGSLTRFMLDDIPGVTSPMVYIGMLFSWFAWHVEDHELHSLNFLHTGSPKTWYAVPGKYAFYFEEVIRSKGYEGDIDRLAVLALLGEKTNLLSPELVVTSGIPCCRLVQNPGEYVVTFPRAYHIGFSHGFNCGEAANFGTSQWLKVAKDAAIRRAAMSYLPMLSHQQLLYMLTMSFVSRVPRVLLPGARSSRLRDRQKEERELMVKKTFIDDMLNENKLLVVLLAKDKTFYASLWDPESVSSQSNDHQLFPSPANVDALCSSVDKDNIQICNSEKKISSAENVHNVISNASTVSIGGSSLIESKYGGGCNSHTNRTRIYKGNLEDFYMEYDDLPCGLHVDSGTLACVACGILGFPFMAIVQPSPRASEELFPADNQVLQQGLGSLKPPAPSYSDDAAAVNSSSDPCNPVPNLSQVSKDLPRHPSAKIDKIYHKWNTSNGFLRPRIFCLEHALEIEELLHSKGGANVLVICHSAYLKIKAHALAVAEEICVPFNYKEVPLEHASQEDLNLINISIDDEENEECNEDWTSRMGVNLQHHAKLRKLSPLKQELHVLALGRLFSGVISESDVSSLRWISRRPRTSLRTTPTQSKLSEPTQIEKGDLLMETAERSKVNGANKIKQYSRRSSNCERVFQSQANSKTHDYSKKQHSEVSALKQISDSGVSKDTPSGIENANGFAVLVSSLVANHEVQHESQTSEETGEISKVSDPPNCATSPIEKIEFDPEVDNFHSVGNSDVVQCEVSTIGEARDTSEVSVRANSKSLTAIVSVKNDSVELADLCNVEKHKMQNEICMTEETRGTSEASDQASFEASPSIIKPVVESAHAHTDGPTVEVDYMEETGFNAETRNSSEITSEVRTADKSSEMIMPSAPAEFPGSQTVQSSISGSSTAQSGKRTEESEISHYITMNTSKMEPEKQMAKESDKAGACSSENLIDQHGEIQVKEGSNMGSQVHSPAQDVMELESGHPTIGDLEPVKCDRSKRSRESEQITRDQMSCSGFIRSPCEGLRPRNARVSASVAAANDFGKNLEAATKRPRRQSSDSDSQKGKKDNMDASIHKCGIEGCQMTFETKTELFKHRHNRCTHKGCEKRFRSHKYAVLHQRVHADERPLKCPWKGCTMSFKWAWARTEHLRVHTGERPYQCKFEGCGLTFRFVSDYSRHRRRTQHYVN